jgi:hypothetical protein
MAYFEPSANRHYFFYAGNGEEIKYGLSHLAAGFEPTVFKPPPTGYAVCRSCPVSKLFDISSCHASLDSNLAKAQTTKIPLHFHLIMKSPLYSAFRSPNR